MVGNWTRHGMPNAERPWSLKEGVKGLERAVAASRRCRWCHYVCEKGPERCPNCDRKYPVPVTRAGLTENQLAAMPGFGGLSADRISAMSLRDLLPLAHGRLELERIAAIKRYRSGWVDHVMRERNQRFTRRWA